MALNSVKETPNFILNKCCCRFKSILINAKADGRWEVSKHVPADHISRLLFSASTLRQRETIFLTTEMDVFSPICGNGSFYVNPF